jgi:HPt (histidine-containing phosphotransfer) domain-containing protein
MAEDRQKCLEAGMVDHITKPVDADTLVQAILMAVHRQRAVAPYAPDAPDALAEPASVPAAHGASPVDWDALQKTVRKANSQTQFLHTFLDTYASVPATLRTLQQTGDSDGQRRLVHKIVGATGFLCAPQAQQQAKALQEQLRAGALPGTQLAVLADSLEQVLQAVRERLDPVYPAD